ncbi:MAG TPA: tetratricopeptide repeat protein [Balneolaceae bacterium]|nr:tetratricopeptide repeat protein [Balneolaceae bacterium]
MSRKLLVLIVGFVVIPCLLMAQQEKSSLEQQADSLYKNFDETQALEVYKQILKQHPNDYQALWRTSFLYSRIGNRQDDKDEKKAYFNEAINLAQRALKIDSTDTQSNFVMAVAMGRKALISGAKARVAASRDIKKYAELAIKYDSTNAGAWHVLGRWHLKVANLSWIERMAANTLFGGIPKASNQKAEEYIKKAIQLNGKYILYYHDLARVYKEMGQDQKAINTCQTALNIPKLTPDDDRLKQECRDLIEDLR